MNLIALALRRPITVVVVLIAIVLGGVLALRRMPVDIFPKLDLPVVYVCQPYGGMDPAQMEGLLTNYYEYHFLYINGIHHVESKSVQGMALMKLVFHPGTNMAQAMAETVGYVNRSRAFMPPGTVPPFIMRFDTGSVPVGYLVLSSETVPVAEIQDKGLFTVRPMFAALPGVSAPPPFGGSARAIVINLDPDRLRATGASPEQVVTAVATSNTISPSGNVYLGNDYPMVPLNSLIRDPSEMRHIPLVTGSGPPVYLGDVALSIEDSSDLPTGYALVNGRRAVYILVTKRADASTLDVVHAVRTALPRMQAALPSGIHVRFELDQSPYVTRAMRSLWIEGALGAVLTGGMVLLFLRDWRTALVVVMNIPLALLAALIGLWVSGQTINLMTLGGLALSIGILVDEATVELENIHTQFRDAPTIAHAVRNGNAQTAIPRLLSMLCILAVFLPSLFMQGSARALFVPLSLAVCFAMLASYLLSSTLVPVASTWMLRSVRLGEIRDSEEGWFARTRGRFERRAAQLVAAHWLIVPGYLVVAAAVIVGLGPRLGAEIFPTVDVGQFRLRLRAPVGTHFDHTEQVALRTLDLVGQIAGRENIELTLGYVGSIPSAYPINAVYQWSRGPEEAILRVALKPGSGVSVEHLQSRLRDELARTMPNVRASFEPGDIINEIMSFGSPTPIEVAVIGGQDPARVKAYLEHVRRNLAAIPAIRDLQSGQSLDYPTIEVELDRRKAALSGVRAMDVSQSLVPVTSSSRFTVPSYWPDPKTGIGYQVQVQVPQRVVTSVDDLSAIPVKDTSRGQVLLRDVAVVHQGTRPGQYDRYNNKRELSLRANIAGGDLHDVGRQLRRAIADAGPVPEGAALDVRGQIPPLEQVMSGLASGLVAAVVVIFLLLAANFQSWRLALVTVSTAPAAIAGVVLALLITGMTINLQSFIGAIMAVGVAMANAILLVTFAEHQRREGQDAGKAAASAAAARLRPILMTTCAMLAGMLPMAVGWGEGAEQIAPLGRAVIGGLFTATCATLLVLPAVYAIAQRRAPTSSASLDPTDPASVYFRPSVVTAVLVISCLPASGCGKSPASKTAEVADPVSAARVSVVRPQRKQLERTIEQPASVVAFEHAPLFSRITAYVDQVHVDIGDTVQGPRLAPDGSVSQSGQKLATLAAPELEADFRQHQLLVKQAATDVEQAEAAQKLAHAAVASALARQAAAESAISRSRAELAYGQSELKRFEEISARGSVTPRLVDEQRVRVAAAEAQQLEVRASFRAASAAVDEARAAFEKSQADVASKRTQIDVARAAADKAAALWQYHEIRAPFDGVVTARNVHPGHLVQPGPAEVPLMAVARVDKLRIFFDVPEADATQLAPDATISVRFPALGGDTIAAPLTRTAWSLDDTTRTLRCELDVPNPKGKLRPGLYGYARATIGGKQESLVLPASAVFSDRGQTFCAVVRDGHVHRVGIRIGVQTGNMVEVVAGLNGSEEIIQASGASLSDGQAALAEVR